MINYFDYLNEKDNKWIQKAIEHPGSFSDKAKKQNMETDEFADYVINNKDKFDSKTIKQAYLAKNLAKMRKKK